ncbi:protein similar isoform X1 [Schistocerca nitens]|uniref:protein similar isoform X1 n=1 Tax=Schistocerca nitens TaxID=7011 RepID=UPI00211844EA|nr:protein similar isoform X1 [Schistocerca nitens]
MWMRQHAETWRLAGCACAAVPLPVPAPLPTPTTPPLADTPEDVSFRNSEKRKEKSRDAARCRRSRETEIFTNLAQALPLPQAAISQLDKASIMRLAISYLKIRDLLSLAPEPTDCKADAISDPLFLKALEGFLLVLSADGDMIFLSDNINEYLGIPQIDLMGHSIYEFSHPCDHEEIKEILSIKTPVVPSIPRSFFIRMKCTLTSKGRNVNIKSATYKVIHCTGHVLPGTSGKKKIKSESSGECSSDSDCSTVDQQHCLVAIGEPIPHPSNIEIPLDKQTFLSKHSLDMKFTYADENIGQFLGFHPDDLIGKSVYEYHHAMDRDAIEKGFKSLFSKGQCETGQYRFLAKNGGYVWVLTQATLIYGSKSQKPLSVVCLNFVISGIEHRDEVYASCQLCAGPPAAAAPAGVAVPLKSGPCVAQTVSGKLLSARTVTARVFSAAPAVRHAPQTVLLPLADLPPAPAAAAASPATAAAAAAVHQPRAAAAAVRASAPAVLEAPQIVANKSALVVGSKLTAPPPSEHLRVAPDRVRSKEQPQTVTAKVFTNVTREAPQVVTSKIFSNIIRETPQVVTSKIFSNIRDTPPQTVTQKAFVSTPQVKEAPSIIITNASATPVKNVPQAVTSKIFASAPKDIIHQQSPPKLSAPATDLPRPQATTSKIFAPRTEDMNKGYLMFSDEEPGLTILKDEPEDLTHLAPTAGDVCVPLETNAFITDMFDDIMLSDNYCPLLNDDLNSLSDSQSSNGSKTSGDPFFSYREELSPSASPSDLSSSSFTKSPGGCSMPSLCSPSLSGDDDHMTQLMSVGMGSPCTDADEDLTMRAPYIPMGVGDDLPLLISADLMWGPLQDKPPSEDNWSLLSPVSKPDLSSNLAQLLCSDSTSSPVISSSPPPSARTTIGRCNDHGGGLVDTNNMLSSATCKKGCVSDSDWPKSPRRQRQNGPPDPLKETNGVTTSRRAPDRPPCKRVAPSGSARSDAGGGAGGKRPRQAPGAWIPDGGGTSSKPPPPGESVLMNLLVSGCDELMTKKTGQKKFEIQDPGPAFSGTKVAEERKASIRKNSFSLLEPESSTIPSLADLSQQDYDVNAPVSSSGGLLQGQELLSALEVSSALMG